MQEALFYKKKESSKVRCLLCPWFCELKPGQTGACKVRKNTDGILETLVFNKLVAYGIDPIEKKPLYHFQPGKNILSIGLVGCNLHCTFCQNYKISQCQAELYTGFVPFTANQLLEKAAGIQNNAGIAFTYNEPFTFYEFMLDTAKLSYAAGMKNVVVTNGYVNPAALKNILPYTDAYNIDLKAFDDKFYRQQTTGKLNPVLKTIITVAKSKAHLEITNLIIPGLNDNENQFVKMVKWIAGETGNDTPLHLSRYYPQFKLKAPHTPFEQLKHLYHLAKKHLNYVYIGNVNEYSWSDTFCLHCGEKLITRNHYSVTIIPGFNGKCPFCGTQTPVIF